MPDVDAEIDALYRLPLDAFTAARNALAKRLGRPTIKDLGKPSVPAWAVNQLFWEHRAVYDRLVKASERLRGEHRKLLAGKTPDLRDAEGVHRDAMREAAETIKGLLAAAGDPASPATMTAVSETLQSLPGAERPGRLTRPLKPLGFEALSGVSIGRSADRAPLRVVRGENARQDAAREKQRAKEEAERLRQIDQERKAAKAELGRAEAAVARAREAVEKAEAVLEEKRAELDTAKRAHHRARLRARE